ncbi:hypothetical protein [Lacibacter sediminis]|uniref:Outer membrane beta-barrel protein n=1 Tax=Lacibacter sediminis TaxID=2760713 RepID=A0A7G5XJT4_9BACT|nr:hypothetical protein [Lacibacter sediminis]QNA45737.1 hypothetical protein H4075_05945 [Lacibacter sediminis]
MKKIFTVVFLVFTHSVLAQTKTLPGYYINLSSDTVTCQISFKDWAINPTEIKIIDGKRTITLGLRDMLGFGVSGKTHYVRKTVTYHLNPLSGLLIPEQFSDSVITKEVMLKIVRRGKFQLYELVLPERDYFFIENKNKEIAELIYRVRKSDVELIEDEQFKQQLYRYLVEEGLADSYIWENNKITYSAEKIGKIVNYINGANSSNQIQYETVKPGLSIELKTGAYINFFPTQLQDPRATMVKLPASISPSLGLDLIFALPGKFQRAGLGLGVSYNHIKVNFTQKDSFLTTVSPAYYFTTKYNYTYSSSIPTLFTNFFGFFVFNPTKKVKFFMTAGLSYHFTLKKQNGVDESYQSKEEGVQNGNIPFIRYQESKRERVDIVNGWFNFNTGLGCSFGRHKLNFTYVIPSEVTARTNQNNNFTIGNAGLFYHFEILKNR